MEENQAHRKQEGSIWAHNFLPSQTMFNINFLLKGNDSATKSSNIC